MRLNLPQEEGGFGVTHKTVSRHAVSCKTIAGLSSSWAPLHALLNRSGCQANPCVIAMSARAASSSFSSTFPRNTRPLTRTLRVQMKGASPQLQVSKSREPFWKQLSLAFAICVGKREGERESLGERARERESLSVCVCVCVCARAGCRGLGFRVWGLGLRVKKRPPGHPPHLRQRLNDAFDTALWKSSSPPR